MKRIYLFPIPFIVTYTIGKVYEYINIKKRLLVDKFGCGCKDGFNTNDITNILVLLLFLSSVVLIVVSTKKMSKKIKIPLILAGVIIEWYLCRNIMWNNRWL